MNRNWEYEKTLPLHERNNICTNPQFFIKCVWNNLLQEFQTKGHIDNINEDLYYFKYKLDGYYNFITKAGTTESIYLEEVILLSNYIELLFKEAQKENGELLSVFESEEDKQNFYNILPEYFGENQHNKIMEIREHTPGFTKAETEQKYQDEMKRLEEEEAIKKKKEEERMKELRKKFDKILY